jgi:hypothetical protein
MHESDTSLGETFARVEKLLQKCATLRSHLRWSTPDTRSTSAPVSVTSALPCCSSDDDAALLGRYVRALTEVKALMSEHPSLTTAVNSGDGRTLLNYGAEQGAVAALKGGL